MAAKRDGSMVMDVPAENLEISKSAPYNTAVENRLSGQKIVKTMAIPQRGHRRVVETLSWSVDRRG